MRQFAKLVVFGKEVDAALFEQLGAIHPEGCSGGVRGGTLPLDDPRMQAMLSLLENAGLKPRPVWRGRIPGKEFALSVAWRYDESDIEAAEYLELRPWGPGEAKGHRSADDGLIIVESKFESDIVNSYLYYEWYVVKDRVREIFTEIERVPEAEFLPTTRGSRRIRGADTPYWELRSRLTMPALSPTTTVTDANGQRVAPKPGVVLDRSDGYYIWTEFHYRRSDLRSFGDFAIAHTLELFGGDEPTHRPLIASQRFYNLCKRHGIKTGWAPVRIDEE